MKHLLKYAYVNIFVGYELLSEFFTVLNMDFELPPYPGWG